MKKNEIIAPKVEKRKYFCIVKHLESFFSKIIIGLLFIIISNNTHIAKASNELNDSIEVSLLTCAPHNEVYSLYGHTAIRYFNKHTGEDWVFNYGVFDFNKSFFILKFIFGITDYQLGVMPFHVFQKEYEKNNRQVIEQVLNLTLEEKEGIYNSLKQNYRPENRIYRYNFIYNNCTTKARDIIEKGINGTIIYPKDDNNLTIREYIHKHTSDYPWTEFGNDLCLGLSTDLPIDNKTKQFLPFNLFSDFKNAQIYAKNNKRPLVKEQRIVVDSGMKSNDNNIPLSPTTCGFIIFAFSLIIAYIEYKKKMTFITWDVIMSVVFGTAGIITLALFCSLHPSTSTNLTILILNPTHYIYIYPIIKRKKTKYWHILTILIIAFFVGSIWQNYATGIIFMALTLLTRCYSHLILVKEN